MGAAPTFDQRRACARLAEAADLGGGVALLGRAGCGKSSCVRAAAAVARGNAEICAVSPGALPLEDCFGTASGARGCVLDRLLRLAAARKARNGAGAWIVIDGPLEACWTEALAAAVDRCSRGEHAPTLIVETDALTHASPATVGRLGVVWLKGFREGGPNISSNFARAYFRQKANLDERLLEALDAFLTSDACPLEDALERAANRKGDDDDDDARRLRAFCVLTTALLAPRAGADVNPRDASAAAPVACAWALAWGVLGLAMASPKERDATIAWLRGKFSLFGNSTAVRDACSGLAPRPDLQAFAPWAAVAAVRGDAVELERGVFHARTPRLRLLSTV